MTLLPGALAAVQLLTQHRFLCPVITGQSRISKQLFTEAEFCAWFATFQQTVAASGGVLVGPYVCSHQRQDGCSCYKPSPQLYLQAVREHGIDLAASVVIGDTHADMLAAQALNILSCLVRTGCGERDIRDKQADHVAHAVVPTVLDAARWAISR